MGDNEVITLKEYMDVKFLALEQATKLAASAMEKRLDGMNEFREALKDQQNRFLPREEYTLMHEKLCGEIKNLEAFKNQLEGKASQVSVYVAWAIAAIGFILSAIALFIH